MDALQTMKFLPIIAPQAIVDNAAFASAVVDTKGYERVTYIVHVGATDIAMAGLKVQESDALDDATTLTSGADISGAVFGTSLNTTGATSAVPSATDDNKLYSISIPCGAGRKRYQKLVATGGDGTAGAFVTAIAICSKPEVQPVTALERGFDESLHV